VIKDIFRRYPNRYESIIATLCDNLDTLDEPQAKASMVWIIGEYAERIDNADELLDNFLETFEEEDPSVQLQLLTATVKCFLKNPEDTQDMVQRVLDLATEESDNPDLRDRGFIYWRLLSTDPEAAKLVVLGDKPVIEDDTFKLEPNLLNTLIGQIATLSSIYHKPPEAFVVRASGRGVMNLGVADSSDVIEEGDEEDYEDDEDENENDDPVDLLDMGGMGLDANPAGGDLFGTSNPQVEQEIRLVKACPADKSGGIDIYSSFRQVNGNVLMELEFQNISSTTPVSSIAIQLNKNAFGLSPVNQQIVCDPPIAMGSNGKASVQLVANRSMLSPVASGQPASPQIQIAVKNMATSQVFYFAAVFNLDALCSSSGQLDRTTFIETWKNIDDGKELYSTISDLPSTDIDQIQAKFETYNIFFIARRQATEGQEVVYFSMKTLTGMDFLVELTFKAGINACKICIKTENTSYGELAKTAIENLLRL